MKTVVEVASRKEARFVRLGLAAPEVKAFVVVMGILSTLPTQRSKERVMKYVQDHFDETGSVK